MKKLICTVGLPRSGKSTWARQQAFPIVNPDSIRLAMHGQRFVAESEPHIWAIAKTMVNALFLAGHDIVILDATNTTIERRREWVSKKWQTEFKLIPTTKEVCIQRAKEENDEYIIPIIEQMADKLDYIEA